LKDKTRFEPDSTETERLEKCRHDEYLSARKFAAQDTISSESMQGLDIKTATKLYEGDVAQNRSFSEADLKAGIVSYIPAVSLNYYEKILKHWPPYNSRGGGRGRI
jgi:hypothetical protein